MVRLIAFKHKLRGQYALLSASSLDGFILLKNVMIERERKIEMRRGRKMKAHKCAYKGSAYHQGKTTLHSHKIQEKFVKSVE